MTYRILVVEDQDDLREIARFALEGAGWDLAEIGKVLGVKSQRFRELKLWADADTGKRKLGDGLSELNLLQPPSGVFPVSSFAAYHLIRMAISESLTNAAFLLKTYAKSSCVSVLSRTGPMI